MIPSDDILLAFFIGGFCGAMIVLALDIVYLLCRERQRKRKNP